MKNISQPKISVVVPIYNTPEKYLKNNLQRLKKQTLNQIEVILIDDGSESKTAKICDYYVEQNKNFRVIHKKNAGLSAAKNTGVKESSGEYILFIDGDDFVEYDAYAQLYPEREKPDVVCACMSKNMNGKIKEYDYSLFRDGKIYKNSECKFFRDNVLNFYANISSANGKLFKKSFLLKSKEDIGRLNLLLKINKYRKLILFCIKRKLFLFIYLLSTIRYLQKYKFHKI